MRRHLFLGTLLLCGCPQADADDSADEAVESDDSNGSDDDDSGEPAPVPVDIAPPSSFALTCTESEPNDIDVNPGETQHPIPPWDSATDCGELNADVGGGLLHVSGAISSIVWDSWDGDNDAYSFTTLSAMEPRGVLRWDPLQGDLDAQVWCPIAGTHQKLFDGGLATAALAESAEAAFVVEPGSTCWLFVVGYSGLIADYDFWLEVP